MFQSARLKLTFWYAAIILLINVTISSLIYNRTSMILNAEFNRIQVRLEEERKLFGMTLQKQLHEKLAIENLEQTKSNLLTQLFVINAGITTLVIIFGYILSSKTLAPIAETMHSQEQFIGDASHELRTPLTSLQTSLEVNLADPKTSAKMKQVLRDNLEDVTQLITLTERLLALAKPANKGSIDLQSVSLREIIQSAVKKLTPLADKKHIEIKIESVLTNEDVLVKADRSLLIELLVILADNAIKYSPEHTVVEILASKTKRYVSITVSDQGIGIPAADLHRIFDRFFQVQSSRTRTTPPPTGQSRGYGLGLSLAKKIVDLHDSELSVKSQPSKGTRISFYLHRTGTQKS